ncbi:HAMP domain-containing protein [Mediterraneibacter glycyrrhizinilyticus]|uniref:sensor histidine kinase n=1 Tax=Mediterraneibacter glycyrrhizinilyticus TaxID=342942 RepID=UPI00265A94DB|nr:ATP-binding protein [Mediterraneibacter glycyrrhizinilyticus]MCF2570422.1 HAMP domain-containing protein [Mediterraneibacter glycyrrhizinilyticus]
MKKISLKLKLTLLYTFFMVLLTCAALAILFSLSSREMLSSTQTRLENRVQESVEFIALRNGEIRIDSDFYSVVRDVYLSLYDSDMYFMYGRIPHGFTQQPELADGEIRTIRDGNREWYVYDMSYRLSEDRTVYVRGITSITDAEESFTVTVRFALVLLPLMVLATAVIGYRFTRRTLAPVRQITDTVRQIRADADLSRRIGFEEVKRNGRPMPDDGGSDEETGERRKKGDEIYILGRTFDEMLEELEEVFRREQQFTSDASHELRTPVSVIMAQCDAMLAEGNSLTEEQRDQIGLIQRKARGMADMISQLLFLSRADQGRQPLNKERINISELTEMIAEEQQMLADADGRGIHIETQICPEIWADVDETFYIRMLVNLISNALRYSRENGLVEVSLEQDGDAFTGSVRDYGQGIAADAQPHIWERFYQAEASRTDGSHAGLGLSMVKWIAEAHGGSVSVESEEGQGSTFSFCIPAGENNFCNKIKK